MNKKGLIIIVASVVAVLGLVLILITVSKDSRPADVATQPEQEEVGENDESVQAVLVIDEEAVIAEGETVTVDINLESRQEPLPAAFTVQVYFDPDALSLVGVDVGDIWEEANVLQEEIDNTEGILLFSAGQGFDAEAVGGSLAELTFEVMEGTVDAEVELGEDSKLAYVGLNKEIDLVAEPIRVTTE